MTPRYLTDADAALLQTRFQKTRAFGTSTLPSVDPSMIYRGRKSTAPSGWEMRYEFHAADRHGQVYTFTVDGPGVFWAEAGTPAEWETHPARIQEEIRLLMARRDLIDNQIAALQALRGV